MRGISIVDVNPLGVHLEPHRQPDGTIRFDVKDEALGYIGRVVILAASDGSAQVQVQLDVIDDAAFEQRVARLRCVADEIAAIFQNERTTRRH